MHIEIPDSVKQKAGKCPHDFGCLATGRCGDRELCKIERAYGENVLSLASREQISCPYRLAFGRGQLCTCPVRDFLHTEERSSTR